MTITAEDIVQKLGSMTVLEVIALTKELETKWDVKAEPQLQVLQPSTNVVAEKKQEEFIVHMVSVPADKKMSAIKAVRDCLGLGLKESKDFVEATPKIVREGLTAAEAEELKRKLVEAGAVIEVK